MCTIRWCIHWVYTVLPGTFYTLEILKTGNSHVRSHVAWGARGRSAGTVCLHSTSGFGAYSGSINGPFNIQLVNVINRHILLDD